MKLYVYCLVEGIDELPRSVQGLAGVPVRLLSSEKFSLFVSDFAGDVVPFTRENVLAHAAVVQRVLEWTTPLPFRFGSLVTEEQLNSYINAKREALSAKLEQVRRCVEMSVKIIWDRESPAPAASIVGHDKPGTAFLSEKRKEILGGEARAQDAKLIAEWLDGQVNGTVRQVDLKKNATSKLLLSAAYLVERKRLEDFRQKVAEARRQRPELHFLVSGPWAPYSFANIDLEFKTQFGVS